MRLRQINLFSETHLRDKRKKNHGQIALLVGQNEREDCMSVEKNIAIQSTTMKQAVGRLRV